MTESAMELTPAALIPDAFAAHHQAILRSGRHHAQSLHTEPCPPALADLIAWLPQLTVEARLHPLYASLRPSLAAAGAWTVDTVLGAEDPAHATTTRTAAATARERLADTLAHPQEDRITAMAERCAQALAPALDADRATETRREALTAAHAELLALAVVCEKAPPWSRPIRLPPADPPPPVLWTTRGAANHAWRAASPQQHRHARQRGHDTLDHSATGPQRGDLASVVAVLPALTLDAVGLEIGGGRLDPPRERSWLERAAARAASALWHTEHALPPELPADRMVLNLARQRLRSIEAAAQFEDDPVLDGIHDLATWLGTAYDEPPASDAATGALLQAAGELLAIALLALAALRTAGLEDQPRTPHAMADASDSFAHRRRTRTAMATEDSTPRHQRTVSSVRMGDHVQNRPTTVTTANRLGLRRSPKPTFGGRERSPRNYER